MSEADNAAACHPVNQRKGPTVGTQGLAGAIGISGPRERIASREAAHRATVARAAADLTRRLGGDLGVTA